MPRYAQPQQAQQFEKVIAVLGGNAARLAVLSEIAHHPRSTTAQVVEATGLTLGTVRHHLRNLVQEGVIDADPPVSADFADRSGQMVYYSARLPDLANLVRDLARSLGVLDRLTEAPENADG